MRWRHRLVLRDKRRERRNHKRALQVATSNDAEEKSKTKTKSKSKPKLKAKNQNSLKKRLRFQDSNQSSTGKVSEESMNFTVDNTNDTDKPPMFHAKFSEL